MNVKEKGVFMLWIEVELAWGLVHRKKLDLKKLTRISICAREALGSVMSLLEKYRVPVTWSVVGHLLLDRCSRDNTNELPHPEMPRPNYSWLREDWYRYDPCTDVLQEPAWYGKDITDRIFKYVKQSSLPHSVGCHSFSHQLFGDLGCDEELARAEIKKCIQLMKEQYNIVPKVFAFPRDYVGHLEILKEFGFRAYRDAPPKIYPCLKLERTISNKVKTCFSLFIQFLSYYVYFPPHIATAREVLPGLWTVPGCLAYSKKPFIPLRLVTFKVIQGINKSMDEGKIFSMYTHLRNFGEDENFLFEFEKILSYVNKKRKEGALEIKTITELVNQLSENS